MTNIDLDLYVNTYVIVELVKKDTKGREKKIQTCGMLRKVEYNKDMFNKKTVYGCGAYYFEPESVVNIWNAE